MKEKYISSPRPMFEDVAADARGRRSLILGGKVSGVVAVVTKTGILLNGYYQGFTEDKRFACMREFVEISWEELEKIKSVCLRGKAPEKEVVEEPDEFDESPDQEYLDSLPQVTMAGRKFYLDIERRERRPVDFPKQVFKFREVLE